MNDLILVSESRGTYERFIRPNKKECYSVWTWQLPLGEFSAVVEQVKLQFPDAEIVVS